MTHRCCGEEQRIARCGAVVLSRVIQESDVPHYLLLGPRQPMSRAGVWTRSLDPAGTPSSSSGNISDGSIGRFRWGAHLRNVTGYARVQAEHWGSS